MEWITRLPLTQLQLDADLDTESVRTLAECRWLRSIASLKLSSTNGAALCVLAQSPNLIGLHRLDLSWNSRTTTSDVVLALAHSPYLSELEALGLGSCWDVDEAAIRALLDSPHLRKLKQLHINTSFLSDTIAAEIRQRFKIDSLSFPLS